MSDVETIGKKLDAMGWTLVNMGDPVTGDPTPALDWEQVAGLVGDFEEAIDQYRLDLSRRDANIRTIRAWNLESGAAMAKVWERVLGSEQPDTAIQSEIAERIIRRLDEERTEVEVTDAMVEALGARIFDPSVVWDRGKIRNGLAEALQTR
ncbi:hypothetical protein SEA_PHILLYPHILLY_22 [Microbacterium phage PhillyPhilly]|nr:hypothetical protein SEA_PHILLYPHILLY_22 [Microbacterium phage PhillyPhilly]